MNKIGIVSPYFGELPPNIDFTIESMRANKSIDWYIITDSNNIYSKENVKVIYSTFEEVRNRIYKMIGTTINSPYKLCDYKPTYGYIYYDILKDYDYWGYCDLDIIFGDIDKYINQSRLNNYDKIFDLGHFSILKNNQKIIQAFKGDRRVKVPYQDILNSKYIHVFDESYDEKNQGINGILKSMNFKVYEDRNEFSDIDIKYENFKPTNLKKIDVDFYYLYNNGKLFEKKNNDSNYLKEIIYVHLQKRKDISVSTKEYEKFIVTPKCITNLEKFNEKCFYKGRKIRTKVYINIRIKRKINNIKKLFEI